MKWFLQESVNCSYAKICSFKCDINRQRVYSLCILSKRMVIQMICLSDTHLFLKCLEFFILIATGIKFFFCTKNDWITLTHKLYSWLWLSCQRSDNFMVWSFPVDHLVCKWRFLRDHFMNYGDHCWWDQNSCFHAWVKNFWRRYLSFPSCCLTMHWQ